VHKLATLITQHVVNVLPTQTVVGVVQFKSVMMVPVLDQQTEIHVTELLGFMETALAQLVETLLIAFLA